MLKRNIIYTDFNGQEVYETYYFNLAKHELIELELSESGGFGETLNAIIEAKDNKTLVALFKNIILQSYGQKSEDGKRFVKNAQLREEFSQTAAFDSLFMELATNDNAAIEFIRGVIPADIVPELDKELKTVANKD